MRAWQVKELGNPIDVLELNEIPDPPDLQAGEVQVSIQSVGISFPDVLQCRGEYQIKPSLPWIPGGESAGVVNAIASISFAAFSSSSLTCSLSAGSYSAH